MELDGYCKELNLAFEYHGIQHYKEIDFFHRKTLLDRRRKDDETKRLLCKQNCVTLIEIPYTVKPEELQEFIYSQCVILGITVSRASITQLLPPEGGRLQTGYKPAEDLTYVSY